ncbi:MAG: hypothetical protein R3F17_16800, partial [Planctomycetota bacterium]
MFVPLILLAFAASVLPQLRIESPGPRPLQQPVVDEIAFTEALAGFERAVDLGGEIEGAIEEFRSRVTAGLNLSLQEPKLWQRCIQRIPPAPSEKIKVGKVEKGHIEAPQFGREGLSYSYLVPREYRDDGPGYPLILTLPEPGERTSGQLCSNWIPANLRQSAILVSPEMPEDAAAWNSISVAGVPGGISRVLTCLRAVRQRFRI